MARPEGRSFLGWKHPGPIEALRGDVAELSDDTFLGWKHPGPIEATREICRRNCGRRFLGWKHPGPIEAQLKLATRGGPQAREEGQGCRQHAAGAARVQQAGDRARHAAPRRRRHIAGNYGGDGLAKAYRQGASSAPLPRRPGS